jgi:hypothetical protein
MTLAEFKKGMLLTVMKIVTMALSVAGSMQYPEYRV